MSETHTWSVSQVNEWATLAIAQAFPDDLWIEGEICNLSRSARGHVYFTLIEAGDDRRSATTSLSVTLFDWNRQKVNLHLRRAGGAVRMEDGVRVRIRGRIELYAAKAQVQFRMIAIDPAFTLGDLAAGRARILAALAAEGLLEANARLPRPVLPLRVGLVTSLGSAAHGDFLHEIELSGIGFDLVAVDARVQGIEADVTVAAAIAELHRHGVALIALVRGGGARTDLAAFDSEVIARAIATSPLPVWSGIGHEVDRTIADEVCSRAFKTPTACAAALVETVRADIASAEDAWSSIARRAERRLDVATVELDRTAHLTAAVTRSQLDQQSHRLERHGDRVRTHAGRVTDRAGAALDQAARSIAPTARRHLDRATRDVRGVEARVRAYDPARTLAGLEPHATGRRQRAAVDRRRPAGRADRHHRDRRDRAQHGRRDLRGTHIVTDDLTDPDLTDPEIGYADAIAELNEILADLEDDELDIDILGDRVARAATLIALCRDRIDVARLRVTEIVATLDAEPEA